MLSARPTLSLAFPRRSAGARPPSQGRGQYATAPPKRFQWSREVEQSRAKKIDFGGYLLLSIPIATFGLGVWQVQRRQWKLNLIAELDAKTREPPIPLPDDLSELSALEYRKVTVRGEFDHDNELFIGPRTVLSNQESGGGLISSGAGVGWHVVTPFKLADRNLHILVNRGWVPKTRQNPINRPEGQVRGEVSLVGIVRLSEPRQQFAPRNREDTKTWQYRDISALAQKLGTAPVFVDADAQSTVPGGPLGGQTRVSLRNEHLSYLMTWFSLSAATSYMWFKRFVF